MLLNLALNCMTTVFHLQNVTVKGLGNNQEQVLHLWWSLPSCDSNEDGSRRFFHANHTSLLLIKSLYSSGNHKFYNICCNKKIWDNWLGPGMILMIFDWDSLIAKLIIYYFLAKFTLMIALLFFLKSYLKWWLTFQTCFWSHNKLSLLI